jgi:hypothetical protein
MDPSFADACHGVANYWRSLSLAARPSAGKRRTSIIDTA